MDGALGALFRFIPWDFNDSWGQDWRMSPTAPTQDQAWTIRRNRVFAALQQDSAGAERLWQRFAGLRADGGPLQSAWLHAKIDEYRGILADGIERDWNKWSAQVSRRFFRGSVRNEREPASEILYVHTWIDSRDEFWQRSLPPVPDAPPLVCDESRWPDVTQVCGECRVLISGASDRYGGQCDGFCAAVGMRCVGAWEEHADSCEVSRGVGCGLSLGDTDDAICRCGER
jgi:hypothetical protein